MYQLKRDNVVLYEGTENDCYFKLQKLQPQSADFALKYEGYAIDKKK